jgi:tetratricopeptide (TPR) repeat protein
MWVPSGTGFTVLASSLSLAPLLIWGCASTDRGITLRSGTSGPVTWEVVDVSQSGEVGHELRWSYTLVLRGSGTAIQFETLETGTAGRTVSGGIDVEPFTERLEARGRLLIEGSYAIQWHAQSGPTFDNPDNVLIFYRLSGKDSTGTPVRVDIRFDLDRGTGARQTGARPALPASAAPAPTTGSQDARPQVATGLAHERVGETATTLEEALLEDLRDGRLDRHTDLDAALIVSGARDAGELAALRRRFVQATESSVNRVASLSRPKERGQTLLAALHPSRTTETPLLREYAMNATTLIDVIETGRYNCVSATLVFMLLGRRSGLDVSGVLLPSHARAAVRLGGTRVPVEATHAHGFDPGEAELREMQRRFRVEVDNGAAYAEESETEVDLLGLLGAVYTNIATYRSLRGEAGAALALTRRADSLVDPANRATLNRVRVALLNETAVARLGQGRYAEAIDALREAIRLPVDEETRGFLADSLTAAGLDWLSEIEASADDATILAFADRFSEWPDVREEVHAYALRHLAYRRANRDEWEPAVADLRQAAGLTRSARQRDMITRELTSIELRRVDDLSSKDVERAWQAFQALPRAGGDDELVKLRETVTHRLVVRRIQYLVDQERCEELDQPLGLWQELDSESDPDQMRAGCHGQRGVRLWEKGLLDEAATDLRRAYRLTPKEPPMEQNLIGVLQALVDNRVRAGRCQDARPLIAEGLALAPDDAWLRGVATTCGVSP